MTEQFQPLPDLSEQGGIYVTASHRYGTDALLLARFSMPSPRERACDLGTGCGIIPLLWCVGGPPVYPILAVELQPEAAALAKNSVAYNGLTDHIQVLCADWRELPALIPEQMGTFDRVCCNPPYFPPTSGGVSRDEGARIARHEPDSLLLPQLAEAAGKLLKNGGKFALCHRPERLCDVLEALRSNRLEPKRLQLVQQTATSAPWLILCEARKAGRPGLKIQPPLILEG